MKSRDRLRKTHLFSLDVKGFCPGRATAAPNLTVILSRIRFGFNAISPRQFGRGEESVRADLRNVPPLLRELREGRGKSSLKVIRAPPMALHRSVLTLR